MKKSAVLIVTFLFLLSVAHGQTQNASKEQKKEAKKEMKAERVALKKLEGTTVSPKAKDSFIVDFGNIPNVMWKRSGNFDEARFTNKDGKSMTAYYDISGKLVGTTSVATFADLPAKGQQEIKNKYKDYTIGPVIFYDDNEQNETDMVLYAVQFDDADNYFVELTKGTNRIVVVVNMAGNVTFFKQL
jgi:hypothetical protein